MTMPHLMNCSHKGDGWCLTCVKDQHDESEKLREQLLKACERLNNGSAWADDGGEFQEMCEVAGYKR